MAGTVHVVLRDPFGTDVAQGDLPVIDMRIDPDTTIYDQLTRFMGTDSKWPLQGSTPNAALPYSVHLTFRES